MKTNNSSTLSRRSFLKLTSVAGTFLAVGFSITDSIAGTLLQNISGNTESQKEIHPLILIDESGNITIFAIKPEMGQGTWQSIPTIIAEELEANPLKITIRGTKGEKKFGNQSTGGSSSVRGSWNDMRKAGASVKEMLITAASQKWNVPVEECYASEERVYHKPSGKSLSYGELVAAASSLDIPENPKLKEISEFKWIGKSIPRHDIPQKTNGTAMFGIDYKVLGMVYASIERCPNYYGEIKSIDDSEAKAVAGVKDIRKCERFMFSKTPIGVAVIAENYYSALQGRKKLKVEWNNSTDIKTTTEEFSKKMEVLSKKEGIVDTKAPGFDIDFSKAKKKLRYNYETPFQAHAPMEPSCALVHVKENSCEVWAPVQGPDGVRKLLADYLKFPEENIIVNAAFMGGSFGRKSFYDYIWEAVYLSKELSVPVKVIWTREDDIKCGPFRPGMVSRMEGYLDKDGALGGIHHKVIAPSIQHNLFKSLKEGEPDGWAMGEINNDAWPYDVNEYKTSYIHAETEVPLLWWRSVYCSTLFFGQESFVDEMAVLANKDPMDFRMDLIRKDKPKFYNLLKTLREKSGWDKPLPKEKGKGVAIAKSFGSIVANVIYTGRDSEGKLKIENVYSAIDCGITVNPDNVKAQIEGSVVMAITAAIKTPITFKEGKVEQSNFHNYPMLRINETPKIEVHVIQSTENPGGVGEPGLPPVAPALVNSIYKATGKRIRKLPFNLEDI